MPACGFSAESSRQRPEVVAAGLGEVHVGGSPVLIGRIAWAGPLWHRQLIGLGITRSGA